MALSVILKGKSATLYLNNSTGAPVAGGAATAANTTPFMLVDDSWTIQAAQPDVVYSGGPPFGNGSFPISMSYANVTESFTLVLAGSSADNVAARKQQLEQVLGSALFSQPCMLSLQPSGATSAMYAEIYSAVVQPTTNYLISPIKGSATVTLLVTITRSPFFTRAAEETCLSGVTFTNNDSAGGSGKLLGTISGDLIFEGQPLNVAMSGGDLATSGVKNIWMAVTKLGTSLYTGRSDSISTTSTSGVNVGASVTYSAVVDIGVNQRFLCRVASPSANLQLRAVVTYALSVNAPLYTSPWVTGGSTSGAVYDLGYVNLPPSARRLSSTFIDLTVQIQARSTNGSSATGTLSWIQTLNYYTFCKLTSTSVPSSTAFSTYGYNFVTSAGALVLTDPPIATAGTSYAQNILVRGQLPRAFDGGRLYLWWDAAGAHNNTDTITVSAAQAPLYRTLRGAG